MHFISCAKRFFHTELGNVPELPATYLRGSCSLFYLVTINLHNGGYYRELNMLDESVWNVHNADFSQMLLRNTSALCQPAKCLINMRETD
jgi:hypothetical protein